MNCNAKYAMHVGCPMVSREAPYFSAGYLSDAQKYTFNH